MQLVVIIQTGQQINHYPVADGLFAKSWLVFLSQDVFIYYFISFYFLFKNKKFGD